jgi:hypothetical protein
MYVNPKKKPRLMKKMAQEELLIRQYPDRYQHYRSIGYPKGKAIELMKRELKYKKTKKGTKTLEKLKRRYQLNVERPGVMAISIQDINRTKAVDHWIEHMEEEGAIIDMGQTLKFSPNPALGRY